MAINDVAGGRVYHLWDILREFLGHDFVTGLRTWKPKNFSKKLFLSSPGSAHKSVPVNYDFA